MDLRVAQWRLPQGEGMAQAEEVAAAVMERLQLDEALAAVAVVVAERLPLRVQCCLHTAASRPR